MYILFNLFLLLLVIVTIKINSKSRFKGFEWMFILSTFGLQYYYIFIESLKVSTVLIIVFLLFYYFRKESLLNKLPERILKLLYFYWIVILVIAFANHFNGATNQLYNSVKYLLFLFGMPIIAFSSINSKQEYVFFNNIFVRALLLVCIYGIFEYFTHLNPIFVFLQSIYGDGMSDLTVGFHENSRGVLSARIIGTFLHPLDYGQFLLISLGYLMIVNNTITRFKKIIFFLIVSNIVFTGSRSCIFPMLLLCCVGGILKYGISKKVIISFPLILFAAFAFTRVGISKEAKETIDSYIFVWDTDKQDRLNAGGSSMELREYQFDTVVEFVKDQSLFLGKGYGYLSTEEWKENAEFLQLFGIESIIFTTILESGIIGLLAFLFLFFMIGTVLCKVANKSFGTSTWILCLAFIGVYFLSCIITGNRTTMQIFFTFSFLLIKFFNQTCWNRDQLPTRFV